MLLYVIRHGDPIYDPDSLTPKGHRQAEAVGRRLATRHFDRIYASTNVRAQQTAQPLCELTGLPMQIEHWASETLAWEEFSHVGDDGRRHWVFQSASRKALRRDESLTIGDQWYTLPEFAAVDGKKGIERIRRDSDAFLAKQGYVREGRAYKAVQPNDDRIALFCHQGFGLTWLSTVLEIPPHIFWNCFDMTHSAVTILRFQAEDDGYCVPQCIGFSDMSHIYAEDLPMVFQNRIEL